jgi:hypothetical protein
MTYKEFKELRGMIDRPSEQKPDSTPEKPDKPEKPEKPDKPKA